MKSESKLYELKKEWSNNLNEYMIYLYCDHNINGVITKKVISGKLESFFTSEEHMDEWFNTEIDKDQIDRTPRTIKSKQIIIQQSLDL